MRFFIYINAYPGVGKLTLAHHLALFPHARVIDRNIIINLATAISPQSFPEYPYVLDRLLCTVINSLAQPPATVDLDGEITETIIIPGFELSLPRGIELALAHHRAAKLRGAHFVSVVLHCDLKSHLRRACTASRGEMGKCCHPGVLTELRKGPPVFQFRDHPQARSAIRFGEDMDIEVDATSLGVQELAQMVKGQIHDNLARPRIGD